MNLKQQLQEDIKNALKQKESEKLSVLRLVMDSVIKKEKELHEDLDDQGVLKLISTFIKRAQDSIEQFTAGNRQDLVDKEQKELNVLKTYLPEQMSEQEIRDIIKKAVESGADNMGAVMKQIMPQLQGKADGKLVTEIVKESLA